MSVYKSFLMLSLLFMAATSCAQDHGPMAVNAINQNFEDKRIKLPDIDLSHWKVTIPRGSGKGGAVSVEPPEILEYATNPVLKPFMYNFRCLGFPCLSY